MLMPIGLLLGGNDGYMPDTRPWGIQYKKMSPKSSCESHQGADGMAQSVNGVAQSVQATSQKRPKHSCLSPKKLKDIEALQHCEMSQKAMFEALNESFARVQRES